MKARLFFALAAVALAFAALGACYDANSSALPACSPQAAWPDPCEGARRSGTFHREYAKDAAPMVPDEAR